MLVIPIHQRFRIAPPASARIVCTDDPHMHAVMTLR
jgi:hypothetical protein